LRRPYQPSKSESLINLSLEPTLPSALALLQKEVIAPAELLSSPEDHTKIVMTL